jgi:hypothetical protein
MLARLGWVFYWAFGSAAALVGIGTAFGIALNVYPLVVTPTLQPAPVAKTSAVQSDAFDRDFGSALANASAFAAASERNEHAQMAELFALMGIPAAGVLYGIARGARYVLAAV